MGETHLKLCKKVAQLTKVIYHLNTRSRPAGTPGDNDADRRPALQQAYTLTALHAALSSERRTCGGGAQTGVGARARGQRARRAAARWGRLDARGGGSAGACRPAFLLLQRVSVTIAGLGVWRIICVSCDRW